MSDWGSDVTATTAENNGGGPRYSGGTFAGTGGTLTDIKPYMSGWSGGANNRVAVYQGATLSGSTLIYDSGLFAHNVNPPLVRKSLASDFGKTVSGTLTASTGTWIVWKTDNGAIGLSNTAALDLSPGSTVEGAGSIGNDPTVAFPSTYPTTSAGSTAEAMMITLVYTASGGGASNPPQSWQQQGAMGVMVAM